jgi:hypothetical protein
MQRKWERYKEKSCPTCGTKHKKKGPYCSRSCGNSRSFTPKQRENLSVKQSVHMNSPEALDARDRATKEISLQAKKRINRADEDLQTMTLDDFMLEPAVTKLSDNQFVQDGDLWTEE